MGNMLEQLELAVCAFRKDRGGERLHDLFDRHGRLGELILCRAIRWKGLEIEIIMQLYDYHTRPNAPGGVSEQEGTGEVGGLTHPDWLQVDIAGGDLDNC